MTDLSELLERVKAATGPDRELDGRIAQVAGLQFGFCGDGEGSWRCGCADGDCGAPMGLIDDRKSYPSDWREDDMLPACTASVDAALAFAERVLPGWEWLKKSPRVFTLYRPLTEQEEANKDWTTHFDAAGATAPLAIVAAALTALISQEPDHDHQ